LLHLIEQVVTKTTQIGDLRKDPPLRQLAVRSANVKAFQVTFRQLGRSYSIKVVTNDTPREVYLNSRRVLSFCKSPQQRLISNMCFSLKLIPSSNLRTRHQTGRGSPEYLGSTVGLLACIQRCYGLIVFTGVPHPVTASQPTLAGKPVVLHPAEEPLVTSRNISTMPSIHVACSGLPVKALWP
jgi:hypothetical protein